MSPELHTPMGCAPRRLLQTAVAFHFFRFVARTRTLAVVLALAPSAPAAWALPTFDEVRADFRPSDTQILSREGEVLQRLRTDATVRRGQWVPLADVSPALRQALVLSEDKRFFEHSGVDWRAASAAAWGNLWNQRTRGSVRTRCSTSPSRERIRVSEGRKPSRACAKVGRAQAAGAHSTMLPTRASRAQNR